MYTSLSLSIHIYTYIYIHIYIYIYIYIHILYSRDKAGQREGGARPTRAEVALTIAESRRSLALKPLKATLGVSSSFLEPPSARMPTKLAPRRSPCACWSPWSPCTPQPLLGGYTYMSKCVYMYLYDYRCNAYIYIYIYIHMYVIHMHVVVVVVFGANKLLRLPALRTRLLGSEQCRTSCSDACHWCA